MNHKLDTITMRQKEPKETICDVFLNSIAQAICSFLWKVAGCHLWPGLLMQRVSGSIPVFFILSQRDIWILWAMDIKKYHFHLTIDQDWPLCDLKFRSAPPPFKTVLQLFPDKLEASSLVACLSHGFWSVGPKQFHNTDYRRKPENAAVWYNFCSHYVIVNCIQLYNHILGLKMESIWVMVWSWRDNFMGN